MPTTILLSTTHYHHCHHLPTTCINLHPPLSAGARQNPGETRPQLLERNAAIFASMIPPLIKSSPEAVIIVVSNPCDALAAVSTLQSQRPFLPREHKAPWTCIDSLLSTYLCAIVLLS